MSLLAGAGQARASLVFTLMDSLNCSSAFRTWSRGPSTVTLTQAGTYGVSTSAQLSPESLRGTIFSVEVLYNVLKGTIVFPGIQYAWALCRGIGGSGPHVWARAFACVSSARSLPDSAPVTHLGGGCTCWQQRAKVALF